VKPAPQFDSSSEFFRSRLVTHLSTPFGIRPGDDRIAIGQAHVDNQRLAYSDFVKNCGDPLGSTPNKIIATSRTSYLCNSANLTGEIARFAVIEFHRKVDEEVATYRLQVVANTGKRIGEALLVAFALTALAAASMWVVKGKLG
jgi:hypothetical protein